MRSGKVVKTLVLYMNEYGSDGVEGALSTINQNCYAQLCELDEDEAKTSLLQLGCMADLMTLVN